MYPPIQQVMTPPLLIPAIFHQDLMAGRLLRHVFWDGSLTLPFRPAPIIWWPLLMIF
jgi:hypothetical protein